MNTDFLKDIIPYRCPKCGDSRKFTSLRDLKLHLNSEHAFKVGCVKPRSRTTIFDNKGHNSRKKTANRENLSRQWSSSYDSRRSSSESYGRESPLFQSYKDDARVLEGQLESAREYERNNRRQANYLSRSHSYDPLDNTINRLNKDVMNSHRNIWKSSDELYNAEDVLNGVETAAEERFKSQQNIIQNLVDELQQKDLQITNANRDAERLRHDREKLMNEVEELFKSADFGNKKLLQELETKEQELNAVNNELDHIKQAASDELKHKDQKLIEAERSLQQIEYERKSLEDERENLIEKVQMDSGLLRKTLEMKENQVRKLNTELEAIKQEQNELLSESMELYNTADQGTSKLKDVLRLRDCQLQEAEQELNRLKELNDRLVWESRQLTEQADSHSQVLHELLRQREDELSMVKQDLESTLQSDKPKAVNEQLVQLQQIVLEKTAHLEQKEKELQSLKTFLTTTAEKEAIAREKLEKFISDLIDRADKAEKELQHLKNNISDSNERKEGRMNNGLESTVEDLDSDDEMSDDFTDTHRKASPIQRQVPVTKIKSGYPRNTRFKPLDNTVPYSPSLSDSGYHDSRIASPRRKGVSTIQGHADCLNDINLRTKFSKEGHFSPDGVGKFDTHPKMYDYKYCTPYDIDKGHMQNPRVSGIIPKLYETNTHQNYQTLEQNASGNKLTRSNQDRNEKDPSYFLSHQNRLGPNNRNQYLDKKDATENLINSPYKKDTEHTFEVAKYPMKNQHPVQPFESYQSQQNSSQSLPISEYHDLPATNLPYRSMPHSASQYMHVEEPEQSLSSSARNNLPDRYPEQSEFSSGRHYLPDRHFEQSLSSSGRLNLPKVYPIQSSGSSGLYIKDNSYEQSASRSSKPCPPGSYSDQYLSSSDRQALPRRQYKAGLSLSSSDRQKLPGQGGDNSLSDILSITDDTIQSENNSSFQKIIDENGILWESDTPSKHNISGMERVPLGNNKHGSPKQTGYPSQSTTRLKLSDRFIEERKLFSENIKKIMKLPFLKESGSQAELTNDTLRYRLEKERSEHDDNIHKSFNKCSDEQSLNSQAPFRNYGNVKPELETTDGSTQTWMIDKEYMESDSLSTSNTSHRMDDSSLMASSSENSISHSRILPNSRMENSFEDKNGQEPLQNKKTQKNALAMEQSLSDVNKFENNKKQRDLFEELKQESLNENSLSSNSMYSSIAEGGDNLLFNCKPDNKSLKNSVSPVLKSPVVFEEFDSNDSGKTKPLTSRDIGSKNDLINLSPDETNNSDDLICGMKKESGHDDNLMKATQPATIVNPLHNTVGHFHQNSDNQGKEFNNAVESLTLSPQILEDFENVEAHTEEEVDSVIYDKSTDSVCSNKIFGRNESLTVFSDTEGDAVNEEDVLPPNEEVMMVGDRRKSLSRQLSVDVGRTTGQNILEQVDETDIGNIMMVEETLTPESIDKTFFAQPDTEIEDEYPQSVSSMDGFSLSRSSSQDSVLSERLSQYSQREITRKRRQALCRIFSFLDTSSLIQVALVCREWKKISRHPSLWKHVYLKNQKCSLEFLLNIAKWCTSMETLHLDGLKTREKKEFETQEDYNNRTRAVLEPGLEKLLQVSESTLKTATIIHCENIITDKGLWLVSCYSRVVRKVTYICNTDLPGADVIWALGAGCRDISYLNITLTDPSSAVGVKFNNKCLQVISQFCQDLQTLCVCGTEIDMNGLVLIAKSCQRLTKLEMHYGITVTEDTMVAVCRLGLHNLQQIYFNFTPVEAKAILQLYKSSKHLQKIQISLDISCFDLKGEYKEEDKMKKYADMVKNLKELQKKPGVGNILKLSCGEVFINTEKKFFGLF
ncbi:uncharacterized protein LOC127735559 [Mytilus californianus]|uniref:uncharacterized protein LOC127735559 n=1 Tax=Mytilus californianus TaxID=6549 RepID=UPI002245E115|nr:uncharacterized protein LOC127735559 [Mytilus californianus]XP_052101747.1 uncharacterized protein LOC127735559 [Mytilus californianus]